MLLIYLKHETVQANEFGLVLELMVFRLHSMIPRQSQQSTGQQSTTVTARHGLQAMVCANWC